MKVEQESEQDIRFPAAAAVFAVIVTVLLCFQGILNLNWMFSASSGLGYYRIATVAIIVLGVACMIVMCYALFRRRHNYLITISLIMFCYSAVHGVIEIPFLWNYSGFDAKYIAFFSLEQICTALSAVLILTAAITCCYARSSSIGRFCIRFWYLPGIFCAAALVFYAINYCVNAADFISMLEVTPLWVARIFLFFALGRWLALPYGSARHASPFPPDSGEGEDAGPAAENGEMPGETL